MPHKIIGALNVDTNITTDAVTITPTAGAPADNNTLYIDSSDGYKLKLKNNSGVPGGVGGGGGDYANAAVTNAKTVTYNGEIDNGNSGTSKTIDWTAGQKQRVTMTGNCTFAFTAPPGPGNFLLKLTQDGGGGKTASWPATVKWAGSVAAVLSTPASAVDIISFYYDGTNYYASANYNFG
jgi:hypothetical protein